MLYLYSSPRYRYILKNIYIYQFTNKEIIVLNSNWYIQDLRKLYILLFNRCLLRMQILISMYLHALHFHRGYKRLTENIRKTHHPILISILKILSPIPYVIIRLPRVVVAAASARSIRPNNNNITYHKSIITLLIIPAYIHVNNSQAEQHNVIQQQ